MFVGGVCDQNHLSTFLDIDIYSTEHNGGRRKTMEPRGMLEDEDELLQSQMARVGTLPRLP